MTFRLLASGRPASTQPVLDMARLADSLPVNVMAADLDLRLVFINRAARETFKTLDPEIRRMFQIGSRELLGGSIHRVHRDPTKVQRVLNDRSAFPHQVDLRFGEAVMRATIDVVVSEAGDVVGYCVVWESAAEKERQAHAATRDLVAIASTTSEAAVEVAAASSQSSSQADLVASASEEMSASISEIAQRVGQAAAATSRGLLASLDVNASMAALSSSTAEIAGLVRFIESVASQTNLLALNATIEAARAGESGRGFAVVASEVKSLAQQVSNATGEIRSKVDAIQSDAAAAGSSLQDMGEVVQEINDLQTGIAAAVEQQSATASDISRNINVVAETSRRLNEIASSLQEMAGSVERRSEELKSLIGS